MAVSNAGLVWLDSIAGMSLSLFGLGLGWCFAYVAATTELVDLAGASERGRLIGTTDLLSASAARCSRWPVASSTRRRRLRAARAQRLRPGGVRGAWVAGNRPDSGLAASAGPDGCYHSRRPTVLEALFSV